MERSSAAEMSQKATLRFLNKHYYLRYWLLFRALLSYTIVFAQALLFLAI